MPQGNGDLNEWLVCSPACAPFRADVGLDPRDNIGSYFAQLIDAVHHLHIRGICHLDIKTENMFLDAFGRVKLGDFGLSALIEDCPLIGCRGSVGYAAPENIRSQAVHMATLSRGAHGGYDGQRADIWSCGVVLFVMIYGVGPWEAARDHSFTFRLYKVNFP